MLRESLKRVVMRSTEGNTEKSRGLCMYMPMKRIKREMEMLTVRNRSARIGLKRHDHDQYDKDDAEGYDYIALLAKLCENPFHYSFTLFLLL